MGAPRSIAAGLPGAVVVAAQAPSQKFPRRTQRHGASPGIACPHSPSNTKSTHRDRRKTMEKSQAQIKARENISLGVMMLTIVIANLLTFLYLGPYA
jgi:hypothetical protein